MNSPSRICSSISCKAMKGPLLVSKRISTPSICSDLLMMRSSGLQVVAEAARQRDQRLFQDEADDADHEDGDDDVLHVEVVPLVPHPEADADAAGEHLRGDDDEPRHTDGQTHAGDHMRQRGGEENLAE